VTTIATIEARLASTRLPRKVVAEIAGKPMLERLVERAARSRHLDRLVLATTVAPEDDLLVELAGRLGLTVYRGSVEDVLGRVLAAAEAAGADHVVALTGDNPLVDPELIDDVLTYYQTGRFDYVTTTHMHHSRNWTAERTFPVGVSVQAFSTQVLADAASRTADPVVRGHASFAIYDHPDRYRLGAFEASGKYGGWRHPELRLTVDTPDDLVLMRAIFETLHPRNPDFSTGEAIRLVGEDHRLRSINQHVPQRLVCVERQQSHG